MTAMLIMLWLGFGVLCMFAAVSIAKSKGRDAFAWGLLAGLFGVFAVLIVALMPELRRGEAAGMRSSGGDGDVVRRSATGSAPMRSRTSVEELAAEKVLGRKPMPWERPGRDY